MFYVIPIFTSAFRFGTNHLVLGWTIIVIVSLWRFSDNFTTEEVLRITLKDTFWRSTGLRTWGGGVEIMLQVKIKYREWSKIVCFIKRVNNTNINGGWRSYIKILPSLTSDMSGRTTFHRPCPIQLVIHKHLSYLLSCMVNDSRKIPGPCNYSRNVSLE